MAALPRSLMLVQNQCPGDILMMTAAVRDLHKAYPDIKIVVSTTNQYLWENNPNITLGFRADRIIRLGYETPRMRGFKGEKHHFIYAFHDTLEKELGIRIPRGEPYPDIYLSDKERSGRIISNKPALLVNAGSKNDFPIKQWPVERYQQVVDALKDEYTVIQIGDTRRGEKHPKLDCVLSAVNQTPERSLLSLMYSADAVLTGVSYPMHLCAALNAKDDKKRKCVVVAGWREDPYWEKYPDHDYLTGKPCEQCLEHACWRRYLSARGHNPAEVCTNVEHGGAKCMTDISVEEVVTCLR